VQCCIALTHCISCLLPKCTGHLPTILSKRSRHGTPTFGIILGVAIIVVMDFFSDFDQLIEMLNFSYAISLLMEYAAFVKLRVSQPNLKRPYRIPLDTFGCILFFSPSILLILLVLGLAGTATYVMFAGVALSGILIFSAKQRSQRHRQSHEGENGQDCHQGSIEAVKPDQRCNCARLLRRHGHRRGHSQSHSTI
jgi:amino acid transporter